MTRLAGSPSGGGGGSSGDLPSGAGPFVVIDGEWVSLHASNIPADGEEPGDTDVQTFLAALDTSVGTLGDDVDALELVAYTRVEIPSMAIGNAPTYATILTLTIAPGETRVLEGYMLLAGGSAAAPTSGAIAFGGVSVITARRGSGGGAPTLSGTAAIVSGTVPALGGQVIVSGNDIVVQARATGGPTVKAVAFYRWDIETP